MPWATTRVGVKLERAWKRTATVLAAGGVSLRISQAIVMAMGVSADPSRPDSAASSDLGNQRAVRALNSRPLRVMGIRCGHWFPL